MNARQRTFLFVALLLFGVFVLLHGVMAERLRPGDDTAQVLMVIGAALIAGGIFVRLGGKP